MLRPHFPTSTNTATQRTVLTALTAGIMLVLGFVPLPQMLVFVTILLLGFVVVLLLGNIRETTVTNWPMITILGIAVLGVFPLRGTALMWLGVPALAFVVAAGVWLIFDPTVATQQSQRLPEHTPQVSAAAEETTSGTTPRRALGPEATSTHEAAATDDDSSATAA